MEDLDPQNSLSPQGPLPGYSHLFTLTRAHDSEMRDFFNSIAMQSASFRMLMQRGPKFYDFYDARGGLSASIGVREEGRLVGMGSLVATPCFIGGHPGQFIYNCDLRINSREPHIRREWRDMFGKILKEGRPLVGAGDNSYMVTAILANNVRAKKLVEGKTYGGHQFVPLARYAMVNLVGRFWPSAKSRFSFSRGGSLEEIEKFLISVHEKQAFGFQFGAPHYELRRRLKMWPDFSLNDFFVARDEHGEIKAVTALWNPTSLKQTLVEGPSWTRFYNRVAGWLGLPRFGAPIEFLHMTHLSFAWDLSEADKQTVFAGLVQALWPEKKKRGAHALAFCDFKDHALAPALSGYVKFETQLSLYISLREENIAQFSKQSLGRFPLAFEMALA